MPGFVAGFGAESSGFLWGASDPKRVCVLRVFFFARGSHTTSPQRDRSQQHAPRHSGSVRELVTGSRAELARCCVL